MTGAAGFIGYHVSEYLLSRGDAVLGVDNLNAYYSPQLKRDRLALLMEKDSFAFELLELSEQNAVDSLFQNHSFDVVIHLAAQAGVRYSLENPQAYVSSNLVGFANVLECCRRCTGLHLIYASSSSVYGSNRKTPFAVGDPIESPQSLYAVTKRSNELTAQVYSQLYDMPITGLRFFTVYGPWGRPDMAIYRFADAMTSGRTIDVYNNGKMRRDFTYIDDIADGVVRAAESSLERTGEEALRHRIYNLGNNSPVELSDLISVLEEEMGIKAVKRMLPMQPGDVLDTYADIGLSTSELGFEPRTSIREGIRKFVEWHRDYHGGSRGAVTLGRTERSA